MNTESSTALPISLKIKKPNFEISKLGVFKYANPAWVVKQESLIGKDIISLLEMMSESLEFPKWTYMHKHLLAGERFGHGEFHTDGLGTKEEKHRLITFNGNPTLGFDDKSLEEAIIWEFRGDYLHKAVPCSESCDRLLLRVSNNASNKIKERNFWTQ